MTDNLIKLKTYVDEYNTCHEAKITVLTDELLAKHTSFKIGGPADLFLIPEEIEAVRYLCRAVKETGSRVFFLGNGTNLLFSDEGYRGAVISLNNLRRCIFNGTHVSCEAGLPLINLCKAARDESLSGLETEYGIPGTVGGAVYMNAGAYGGEFQSVLLTSTYLDLDTLEIHTIDREAHQYGYRDSIYRHTNRVILSAELTLVPDSREAITERMDGYMKRRIDKQPLDYPSAGSVFKRPEGYFAGQLIEESGLKGFVLGGAKVSEKHAGFIVNQGGATSADVRNLIAHIQKTVEKNYGVHLECEVIPVEP